MKYIKTYEGKIKLDEDRWFQKLTWYSEKNMQLVKSYIKNGFDINKTDSINRTALFWAAWRGNIEMVKLLLQLGANPDIQDKEIKSDPVNLGKETALSNVLSTSSTDEMIKELTSVKFNPKIVTAYGQTLLIKAAMRGKLYLVKQLIDMGADLYQVDKYNHDFYDVANEGTLKFPMPWGGPDYLPKSTRQVSTDPVWQSKNTFKEDKYENVKGWIEQQPWFEEFRKVTQDEKDYRENIKRYNL